MNFQIETDCSFAWWRSLPFFLVHAACLLVLVVGFSWIALAVMLATYLLRMLAITGGYHRYFSHCSYKTSRCFQFILGLLGACCAQRGPLWWAAMHRHHHRFSDQEEDLHSPRLRGFWRAQVGWLFERRNLAIRFEYVRDLAKFPELKLLDRFHVAAPILFAMLVFFLGVLLEALFGPEQVTRWQVLVWGFFVSTTLLYHATFSVNTLTHLLGRRRYPTNDDSKNSLLVALITLGEGWHNNHHYYSSSERQGFFWWEIDITHYVLKALAGLGLVWDLNRPPLRVLQPAAFRQAA